MSGGMVRKSLLGVIAAAAILVGGIWAGRLAAGPLGHGRRFSAQQIFSRVADRLDLSDTQREQVREVLKAHKDAILAAIHRLWPVESLCVADRGVREGILAALTGSTLQQLLHCFGA